MNLKSDNAAAFHATRREHPLIAVHSAIAPPGVGHDSQRLIANRWCNSFFYLMRLRQKHEARVPRLAALP
jgi:hypothetical protein